MTTIERTIGELEQANYYVGFFTGRGNAGPQTLREAIDQREEIRGRLRALLSPELEVVVENGGERR